jgi:hypothetical protein
MSASGMSRVFQHSDQQAFGSVVQKPALACQLRRIGSAAYATKVCEKPVHPAISRRGAHRNPFTLRGAMDFTLWH